MTSDQRTPHLQKIAEYLFLRPDLRREARDLYESRDSIDESILWSLALLLADATEEPVEEIVHDYLELRVDDRGSPTEALPQLELFDEDDDN